jgi:glutathione synthase/RimK-type ligase-like ATP-grasp enzyme
MKKKIIIGYIFCEKKIGKDEKSFIKIAKKKNIDLILFNISKKMNEKEIKEKAKKCDIIFNNSAEEFVYEIIKTIEESGKKVVDSSRAYYYIEDKWMTFLKCHNHKIPVPDTILLSENLLIAKEELIDFKKWPIILKRIEGCCGDYVEKANNLNDALKIIKKFWKKRDKMPIIAQEFILSPSYRVTIIGKKIVQTAVKNGPGWKKTGIYEKNNKKFKIDKKLKKIIEKLIKTIKINVCGIDLLKKNNKWVVLEVNTTPGLDFFENERDKLVKEIINLLIKMVKKN